MIIKSFFRENKGRATVTKTNTSFRRRGRLLLMAIHFLLLLSLYHSISAKEWVLDNTCLADNPTPIIQKLIPNNKYLLKIIHPCSKDQMDKYSLSAPRGLRWSHNQNKTKELWYSILHQMENQKIVFVGDSVMYQTLIGLLVYLESIGVNCTRMEPSETKYLCNKVELDRPFFIAKLDDQFLPLVLPNILSADIVIVNVGLHYGNMSCGIMSSGLCEDVRAFFHMMNQQIQNKTTHVKLAWMDAHRPHFPSADGAYLSWKDSTSGNEKKYPTCGKIMTPLTYDYVIYNPSHTVEKEFPSIPIIKTYDMTYDRYDMHLGVLTHGDPVKLDCVHLCTQICYWEAISLRIGQVINRILRKGHKT